ncbi:hypothetical protein RWE15_17625 [Virgibacillus halophilus]|uniref:FIMAH domain-containing protein n=1 Tax=Tigheibacillus halophilus TaxID=361280 RepID=A0ABU5C9G4_9BACI|nr:hypothetical protein [Virgibacillus halophilus]
MRNPYDLMAFPNVAVFLNTYSYLDVSVAALSRVLTGEVNPSGELPVAIPDQYEIGHGLDYIGNVEHTKDIQTLVDRFKATDDMKKDTARKLTIHLNAVERFEQTGKTDKASKHLTGFQQLIAHDKKEWRYQ